MWSLGVVLYTMLCGFPPFYAQDNNLKELYRQIKKAEYSFPSPFWDNISSGAKDLVTRLLTVNPDTRFTARQASKLARVPACR
jgi:serine/threonine protein kinase